MWTSFDAVRCISLKIREDRRAKVTARFKNVGLDKQVEFFLAERHPKGSRFGCYESHYLCIKEAYDAGKQNVLIFEDDVVFKPGWEKVLTDCTDFMAQNKEWDALFLGSANWYPQTRSPSHPNIWQGVCAACHAYVVNRQGMQKYLEGLPLDESVVATKGHDIEQFRVWNQTFFHKDSGAIYQEMLNDSNNEWVKLQPNQRLMETALQFELNVLQPLKRYTILVPDRWRPMLICQVKFETQDAAGKVLELGITKWFIPLVWILFFAYAFYLFMLFKVSTWKNQLRLRLSSDTKGATGTGVWSWAAAFLG